MIEIRHGFPPEDADRAAQLFWEAFQAKLAITLGPDQRARAFIASALAPQFCLAAYEDHVLVGLAGFKTNEGGLVGGGISDLAQIYGWAGAVWRSVLLSFFERRLKPDQLLMDGILVATGARGKGIGTQLLEALTEHARRQGMAAIRLDVVDTNTRARLLYERHGFLPRRQIKTGLLSRIYGFRSATTMVHRLDSHEATSVNRMSR